MAESLLSSRVLETYQVTWHKLVPEFRHIPMKDHLKEAVSDFFNCWNFCGCFNCTDWTPPSKFPVKYYSVLMLTKTIS
jgi:hypothetical protein